jgi:TolB protein
MRTLTQACRHGLIALGLGLAALPALAGAAQAQLVIDVRRGNFQPIPIAIADFAGEGAWGRR